MPSPFPNDLRVTDTRVGRMLEQGDVRVTVRYLTGGTQQRQHITVRFKAFRDMRAETDSGKNWLRVPLADATHVFIEVPNTSGDFPDKVGTYYPRTGRFYADRNADPARINAAVLAADWINGDLDNEALDVKALTIQEESYCGVCGRTLTDPVSIDRGIGPECYQQATGSQHQVKVTQEQLQITEPEKQATPATVKVGHNTSRAVARTILATIANDCDDEAIDIIRKELDLWQSQKRQTLFDGRQ